MIKDDYGYGFHLFIQNDTDLYVTLGMTVALGLASYFFSRMNMHRIYYNAKRNVFISSHCDALLLRVSDSKLRHLMRLSINFPREKLNRSSFASTDENNYHRARRSDTFKGHFWFPGYSGPEVSAERGDGLLQITRSLQRLHGLRPQQFSSGSWGRKL